MTSYISHTTIDCADAYQLSEWWKPVLGYVDLEGDPNEPGHEECMIRDPETGHLLLFIEVADPKAVKNRLHFDLRPRAGTRDEELARLLEHGATEVAGHARPLGTRDRVGRAGGPRGQRVLHPALRGRAGGTATTPPA